MGRYHYYRLHPFSLGEVAGTELDSEERLFRFGGFPEPLIAASDRVWRRWQRERLQRVIREDLITLERVNEISQLILSCLKRKSLSLPWNASSSRKNLHDISIISKTESRFPIFIRFISLVQGINEMESRCSRCVNC